MTVTFEDIKAAQARIAGQVDRTPVRHSRRLSQLTGAEARVEELALMLRGESRSETTRKEAAEMLRAAERLRA